MIHSRYANVVNSIRRVEIRKVRFSGVFGTSCNVRMSPLSWKCKNYVVCVYAHGPFRLIASINYQTTFEKKLKK